LEGGLQRPGVAPRHRLFLSLGNLASAQGRYGDALDWFDSALVYQQDQPDALWGMGVAWGDSANVASGVLSPDAINGVPSYDSCDGKDAGEWCQTRRLTPLQSADSLFLRARSFFDRVIPERSGTLELRLDYARILMAQGDDGAASAQIAEAVNLRPNDPLVWTYQAWLALNRGEKHAAKKLLERALKADSPPDLAKILMARSKGAKQMAELARTMSQTVPFYRFNQLNSQYESVGDYPEWQRKLLR
jgi:tetratricopeptide (TPR) repeat protein